MKLGKSAAQFRRSADGNVAMLFALTAPILCVGIAVAVDFANAAITRTRLNAAADAAVLVALTPTMLGQSDGVAKAAVLDMFKARAEAIGMLDMGQYRDPVVSVTEDKNNPTLRVATLSYDEPVKPALGLASGILNIGTMDVGGTSTAQAAPPPNIDFYLLLDNSPSMSIPNSADGIKKMQDNTTMQFNSGARSCAFACHQASTNNPDTAGNLCSDLSKPTLTGSNGHETLPYMYCAPTNAKGEPITQLDNYALAHDVLKLRLRLDDLKDGIGDLLNDAAQSQAKYNPTPPTYRFAAYTIDTLWSIGYKPYPDAPAQDYPLMNLTKNYQSAWNTAQANFGVMEMYVNDGTCGDPSCTTRGNQNDVASNYDVMMSSIGAIMPDPGNGTNLPGDKPQEYLFIVTDGVEDEESFGSRIIKPMNAKDSVDYCKQIRNRNIKIAILYTEYLSTAPNGYYVDHVQPFQNDIGPRLKACATPGLYYETGVDGDIKQGILTLFNQIQQQQAALTQ